MLHCPVLAPLFRFILSGLTVLYLLPAPVHAVSTASSEPGSSQPDLETMAGAMLMIGFRESRLEPGAPLLEQIRAGHLGGVVLFDRHIRDGGTRNVVSPQQVRSLTRALQDAAPDLLLVAVDQEGGRVTRLKPRHGFAELPSAAVLGRLSTAEIHEQGLILGRELRGVGINVDLAPVADVNLNPACPVIGGLDRSFGSDPGQVAEQVLAFGLGLAEAGVVPCLKHFPGHGSADTDSHHGLPDITGTWQEEAELSPYRQAFARGWPGMVLMGHLFHRKLDARLPTSLSRAAVEGLLRGRLGWQGVVITDDLQMRAAASGRNLEELIFQAVNAGNDILLFGNNLRWWHDPGLPRKAHAALVHLVRQGRVSPARLRESWDRIQELKQRIAAGNLLSGDLAHPTRERLR